MSDGEKIGLFLATLLVLSAMKSCTDTSSNPQPKNEQPALTSTKSEGMLRAPTEEAMLMESSQNKKEREALEKRKQALLKQYDALEYRLEGH